MIANNCRTLSIRTLALLLVTLICSGGVSAYSVLTHEEIVDLLWADQIRPLILKRYPGLSEEQIKEAHAYAYGGAVIQDLGYYPFGSVEFSDLVHYVRTGDFVRELLMQSNDARRVRLCSGRSIALCIGHCRPPCGQPFSRHRISEAASEVWHCQSAMRRTKPRT